MMACGLTSVGHLFVNGCCGWGEGDSEDPGHLSRRRIPSRIFRSPEVARAMVRPSGISFADHMKALGCTETA